jgi:cyclopropane-fatty-acyl-phospholipid synthase
LFRAAVSRLDVTVHVGDHTYGRGGPVMVVTRPEEFFLRLGRDQLIGFGEAYLTGAWDAEDLGGFLSVLAAEMPHLIPESLQRLRGAVVRKPPAEEISTAEQSRDNIAHHYDLSNDLFRQFLDPTLSYSSALFTGAELRRPPTRADLEVAQGRKIERLLDQAGVGIGSRVLEIGSGWGELAIRAAHRGATVTTITLSIAQKALADERIAAAGVSDRVSVEICDYREVPSLYGGGCYDAVVSVEMVEAVGWQYWQTYFETIDQVLAPGGKVAIQAITMPHDRMLVTSNTYTWINKYIFPGGFLPSVRVIDEITREHTSLRMAAPLSMGASYAETLRLWDETFLAASDHVLALGFDQTFLRMWHFYLEYSRAGFASSYIDVNQLTFERHS